MINRIENATVLKSDVMELLQQFTQDSIHHLKTYLLKMQDLPLVTMLSLEGEENLHDLFTMAESSDDPKVRHLAFIAVKKTSFLLYSIENCFLAMWTVYIPNEKNVSQDSNACR